MDKEKTIIQINVQNKDIIEVCKEQCRQFSDKDEVYCFVDANYEIRLGYKVPENAVEICRTLNVHHDWCCMDECYDEEWLDILNLSGDLDDWRTFRKKSF